MDMKSRRRFVNSMMAASVAAMSGGRLFAQNYTPMGGVQIGPDGVNGNPPPGPIGGPRTGRAQPGAPEDSGVVAVAARVPRPAPAGIYWISGTGIERQPGENTWDIKDHTKLTMENVKRGVEARGGTMDSFLYMQVFFCLRSDDSAPKPTGQRRGCGLSAELYRSDRYL